jgi:hypothetical protein
LLYSILHTSSDNSFTDKIIAQDERSFNVRKEKTNNAVRQPLKSSSSNTGMHEKYRK